MPPSKKDRITDARAVGEKEDIPRVNRVSMCVLASGGMDRKKKQNTKNRISENKHAGGGSIGK